MSRVLPDRPPFILRARAITPLTTGGTRDEADALIDVRADGRIASIGAAAARPEIAEAATDLRPWVVLPGLVDLHAHLPQLPNAGLGFGLPLLEWLERYIFPLERDFDAEAAERQAPAAFRAFAAAGTTTALLYGAVWEPSLDASFRAAEAHGIRAIIGKVMMDRLTYDRGPRTPAETLDLSLRQSADLCARWHGRDGGRLRYAFTPRFAVSCSAEMLRESARLAASTGAYWQTHISEDRGEIAEVGRLFPEAIDYLDVYDRAGALGARTILAHAVHLSDREVARLSESGARVAHCPESNLFLASGTMPLSSYLAAGIGVGLGSDVAAGPDPSIFRAMRVGAYVQNARRVAALDAAPILGPLDWLRLGTLDGARVLGLEAAIGSIEVGKEADLIAVDPSRTDPFGGDGAGAGVGAGDEAGDGVSTGDGVGAGAGVGAGNLADPADVLSRLIFRSHPDMVRGAWVRGRRLDGPAA